MKRVNRHLSRFGQGQQLFLLGTASIHANIPGLMLSRSYAAHTEVRQLVVVSQWSTWLVAKRIPKDDNRKRAAFQVNVACQTPY